MFLVRLLWWMVGRRRRTPLDGSAMMGQWERGNVTDRTRCWSIQRFFLYYYLHLASYLKTKEEKAHENPAGYHGGGIWITLKEGNYYAVSKRVWDQTNRKIEWKVRTNSDQRRYFLVCKDDVLALFYFLIIVRVRV
jgi:hypothetical protein